MEKGWVQVLGLTSKLKILFRKTLINLEQWSSVTSRASDGLDGGILENQRQGSLGAEPPALG